MHQALQPRAGDDRQFALLSLLAEQRRTNRLLQGVMWGALGFVAGLLVTQLLLRWQSMGQ